MDGLAEKGVEIKGRRLISRWKEGKAWKNRNTVDWKDGWMGGKKSDTPGWKDE